MTLRTSFRLIEVILLFPSLVYAIDFLNLKGESLMCSDDGIIDINTLGFNLMNKLVLQPGNVFFSPNGIVYSLAILYTSAANKTAEQIEDVLVRKDIRNGTFLYSKTVEVELNHILDLWRVIERNYTIHNEVVFRDLKELNAEYVTILKENFLDEFQFGTDMLLENETDNDSREDLYTNLGPNVELVSTLLFNESWKVQFSEERTKRDYFYSGRRETTEVWMMSIEGETFKFYEDLEMRYKFLELPYESEPLSMVLALPTQYDQPANLQMNTDMFCRIKSKLIPTKLDMVSIPKFHFKEVTKVKDALIMIGIQDAFNGTLAEIPGFSADNGFYVSEVKQRINIEVDEDGNSAGSFTNLKFKAFSFAFRGVKEFIANHPFLFYIEDKETGTIMLSGRIDEPSESISLSEHLHF